MRRNNLLWVFGLLITIISCKPASRGEDLERHYAVDYNFLLAADSLVLQEERPMHLLIVPDAPDSFIVYKGDPLVVAQIEVIPEDSIDSVWVKVARDQMTQGWIHESKLLEAAVPDDPVSQGIHFFSNSHLLAATALCLLALAAWLIRRLRKERFHLIHIDDIASPYPMLLCLMFSAATVFYTSIQIFVPSMWAKFYYDPTLNPFGQPPLLSAFLFAAWFIVILFLAAADDIRRSLRATEAVLYMLSLFAFLGFLYIFFSVMTEIFLGYFLWMAYAFLAVWQYIRRHRARFRCCKCGAPLHDWGQCSKCGRILNQTSTSSITKE